ncbi:hypothetical protein Msi02_41330 [Microbispora siamensis]|uniref:Uncharacterized protein n=1 Tax=Microbispora siamensis TaxID=564413 RepID=A0ABQ4GPH6_9ACTN|nr:hypothetical protein Msi02_41330 [Microbispora siamensis]
MGVAEQMNGDDPGQRRAHGTLRDRGHDQAERAQPFPHLIAEPRSHSSTMADLYDIGITFAPDSCDSNHSAKVRATSASPRRDRNERTLTTDTIRAMEIEVDRI